MSGEENLIEEISDENKKIDSDYNKSKRILGQVVTIIYLVVITLIFFFILFDGLLWTSIVGWLGIWIFYCTLIIETLLGSTIRTTLFIVDNFSKTLIFIIINIILNLALIGSAIFIFLYEYPNFPIPALLFFLYPFVISLPINLTLLINHETFSNWFKLSNKKVILSKKGFKILQFSITFFSITFLVTILITPIFIWFRNYFLLIPIACYYSWFIFCEMIWKRITLTKKGENNNNDA